MSAVCIVTAASIGGIRVEGKDFQFLVRGAAEQPIVVGSAAGLREMMAVLAPDSITFECTDAERPGMSLLVESLTQVLH
jgi:hypothetical protein